MNDEPNRTTGEPSATAENIESNPPSEAAEKKLEAVEDAPDAPPSPPVAAEPVESAEVPEVKAAEQAAGETPEIEEDPEAAKARDEAEKKQAGKARAARLAGVYRAYRSRRPLEGKIEKVIKGGYEVRLGKIRGFCPHSQIDLHRVEDPESRVGQSFPFRITQLRRGGEDVVVSRRVLMEDERKDEAAAVRATLVEGSVMQGHIAGLAPFGAFVDLGAGVMGLVHLSELSHRRVAKAEEVVKTGDTVQVRVLKIDPGRDRISLSIRRAVEDPWKSAAKGFLPGQAFPGKVQRLTPHGVFVELAPGIEALAPASELPPSGTPWSERLEPGHERHWQVLSADPKHHRISITPLEGTEVLDASRVEVGASVTGKVQRVERFGIFIWLGPGQVGLMPNALSGVPRGQDVARRFPVGEEVEVDVLELGEGARRIRLARKGVEAAPPERPKSRPRTPRGPRPDSGNRPATSIAASADSGTAFGSILADKLKLALGKSDDAS